MSYSIRMVYTAQIDNSYGIFYSPFNLSTLKIIIDFHSIKLDSKSKLCINCCNFTDYDDITKNPYIYFHNLKQKINNENHKLIYKKSLDRLTKIDISRFIDQG